MSIEDAAATTLPAWSTATLLAKVDSAEGASLRVRAPSLGIVAARLAVPGYAARAGDTVLVTGADDGWRYVIGVVRALRPADEGPRFDTEVRASDGSHARVERDEEGREQLTLRDPEGRLLVSHRPELGQTELHAAGDLNLRAGGDLNLEAAGRVNVRAGTDLALEGRGDVRLTSCDLDGNVASTLTMREGRTQLTTDRLGASVERADVSVKDLNLVTQTFRTVAGRLKTEVERLETRAGQIVEHAKESFRETEGLSQTRAGRLRLVAEKSFSVLAEKALLKARDDVKIKGEKIYLA